MIDWLNIFASLVHHGPRPLGLAINVCYLWFQTVSNSSDFEIDNIRQKKENSRRETHHERESKVGEK